MKQSTSFAQVATNQFDYLSNALCANTPPCKKHSSSRKFLTLSISLRLLLVMFVALTVSANVWGADVTIKVSSDTWTNTGTSGSGGTTKVSKSGVTVSSDKGYKDGTTAIREYSGGDITVSSNDNITKIVFTSTANKDSKYGPNCIALKLGSAGTYTTLSNSKLGTWTGTAKSITFTCSAQFRWTQVVVTTASATKYTVTLVPGSGSVTNTELEGASVDLPTPTLDCGDWEFAGWKTTSAVTTETTTEPTLIAAGTYKPASNITLYAVYQRTEETEGGDSTPTEVSKTYTFSEYEVGTQYAEETYELDDDVTINIKGCHINTQLRVYGGQPGIVISEELPGRIVSMGFNMGYKADNLVVSGSTDGTSWNEVGRISTTTSYKDYTLDFEETNYTYFKLNVEGSNQIRIAKMSITYESTSGGGSSSTTYYHSTPECITETVVTLNPNGGTGSMADVTTENGTLTLPKCTFTREGYTFAGWATSASGEVAFADEEVVSNWDADITELFAKWTAKTITITWDANGGSVNPTTSTYTYNGTPVELPIPTRANYTFNGWFTAASGGTQVTEVGTTNKPTEDVTYYAQWTSNKTATSLSWSAATYSATIDVDNTFPTLTKSPADLSPIAYSSSNTGVATIDENGNITLLKKGETTITATFEETATHTGATASYTLTVHSSNCRWVETEIGDIDSGDEVVIAMEKEGHFYALDYSNENKDYPPATKISVIGNEITGTIAEAIQWNISGNATNGYIIYPNGTTDTWLFCSKSYVRIGTNSNKVFTIENGYLKRTNLEETWSKYVGVSISTSSWRHYDNTTSVIKDQTLKFYKKECLPTGKYWINYDLTNVVCTDDPIKNKISTDNNAVELNFKATGEHNELPTTIIVTNGSTTLAKNTDYTWEDGVLTILNPSQITDNITISIAAQKRKYTITFNANGHGTAPAAQSVIAEGTASEPTAPEATGYTFVGWCTDSECTKVFDFDTPITGNITLTAKWKIITYNITYEGLEGATHSNPSTYNVETATITFTTPSNREDYVFKGWTPASIAKGSTGDKTVTAQWIKAHTVTWKGATYNGTQNVVNGDAVGTLPEDVACSDTYTTFIGWYTKSSGVETNPSAEPQGEEVTAETQPTKDVTYYAVWADGSGNTSTVDELTRETTGVSGTSYTSWSGKTSNSLAVYAGQSAGGNDAIQLRSNNSNSGIITTTSGGKATKVSVTWNINTADDRTLNVYGKNTAYSSPTDLYGDAAGTLIGTIVRGTSTELTISGDYEYIGLRSASGAMYLDEIQITWSSGVDPTGYISSCCQSQAVVTVAPQTTELALNIDGTASTNVHISQEGAGNGKYNQPTISPAEGASLNWTGNYKQAPYDLTFTATQIGTYTITADFTETEAACPRYGTATINVVANPILVVSQPTITSQCGTAGDPVAVTIDSRYLTVENLTAQVATTTVNGQFEICKTENGTFATTNLTGIAAGQDEKASETIYVRYVADVDDITPAVGTLTISDGTTTKTVTLNTTPTCGTSIRMTASDANSIRVTTANGQWTRTQTPIQLRGAYLLQNLEAGQGAKVVLTSSNSNFKFVKPDVQSAGTATFESEKITTETWEQNIHLVYTPTTYDANETTTITAKVITFGGNTEHASSTMEAYGRSFPETFVLALNTGDGWVALPADMTAPYGTSCNTGVGTHDPYPITVDDEANPTAATLAPARAVYKGAARNTPMTNPWTIQLESNELTGYYLFGSNKANNTISNSDQATGEGIKWALSTSDNITYQLSQTTVTEGQKLGYNGTNKVMGQYRSAAVTYKYDFRILPIDGTICTYFVKPVLTLVSFDDNNITYTTPYDGTLNYKISADGGNTWTELTGVLDCKTLSFTLPVATYRGKTIVVKPNAAEEDCITVSDPIVIPNPSIDRGETPWRYTGVVGKPFSDNSKSITINDLQNALNVAVIQQVTNSNISASITPEGVVTISMDAEDATEGEHKAVLEFTSAGAETQRVGVVITIKSLALQEFDGGNEYLFTESTPIVLCHNEMISLGETPTVYLSYPLYMNGSLITELGQFNQTSLTLTDLTSGTSMAAVSREMNGNGVVKLTFGNSITDDLIVGHMYRLSWENTNQVMTDQIGLPYTDCVMDFVFSENCDAPTALAACPITQTGFTANWIDAADCTGDVTVDVYTKSEGKEMWSIDYTQTPTLNVWTFAGLSQMQEKGGWYCANTSNSAQISYTSAGIQISKASTYGQLYSPTFANMSNVPNDLANTEVTISITHISASDGTYKFRIYAVETTDAKANVPYAKNKMYDVYFNGSNTKSSYLELTGGNTETTSTITIKGLTSTSHILLYGNQSSKTGPRIKQFVIKNASSNNSVDTKTASCSAGSTEFTGLSSNTTYYYTVSDGTNTSNEIAVKTYNNDPQVKFYNDENNTKELIETVVVDGKTTTVFVTGQNISGCESDDVVAYASNGYRVNCSALVYDPKTATISGSIELTLTDPTITSGTLTIRDGVNQTYSLPIISGSNMELQVVEWKAGSAVVMYNGDPAQTASVTINGSPAGSTQVKAAEKDVAVYELPVTGLSTSANKHLVITIGANKAILTIPQVVTGTTSVISPNSDLVIVKDGIFQVSGDLTLNNVTIYGGGTLLVPNGQTVNVNTLTMRVGGVEDRQYKNLYPQLQLKGTLTNTSGQINLDYLTTNDFYYPLSVPYSVTIAHIQYPVDIYGANVASDNTGSFQFKYYDGAERAAGKTGWIVLDEETNTTLEPNKGYAIWGIPKKVKVNGGESTRQKFGIHRLPLIKAANDMMKSEKDPHETTVYDYNGSKRDSDSGWNYLGNPYLSHYGVTTDDKVMKLGKLVWDEAQGAWLPTETEHRYVVFTNDCQNYTAERASTTAIPAFSAFFIQADQGGAINFTSPNVATPQSLAARRSEEESKEITTGIILSGEKHSDRTGLLIADQFTEAYEFNADLSKFDNQDMNLYTISPNGKLAFMAINEELAKQTIPLGYSVSTDGMYTIAFDEQRYSRNDIYALYLIDYDRNETTNLLHMDYNFYSETGAHAERFALQVAFAPNTSTDVEYTQVGDVLLSREGNTLRLDNLPSDATVTVYDAVGHLVEQHTASQLLQLTLQKGYYLLHIGNNQNSVVIDTFIP